MTRLLAILLLSGLCLTLSAVVDCPAATVTTNVTQTFPVTYSYPDQTNCLPVICPTCPPPITCTNSEVYPPPPSNIVATVTGPASVTVTWQNPAGQSYPSNVIAIIVGQVPSTVSSFTFNSPLPNSTAYTVAVAGVLGAMAVVTPTNPPPVTGLQSPTGLTAISTAPGSLTLNWTQPGTLSGIWIVTNGTMSSFIATSNGTSYAASESGFISGRTITNTVYAHDAAGNIKGTTVLAAVQ